MKKSIDQTVFKEKNNFKKCQGLAERVRGQQQNLKETKFKLILKLKYILYEDKQLGQENQDDQMKQRKNGIQFYKMLINNEVDPYPKTENIQQVLQNQTDFLVDLRSTQQFSYLINDLKRDATKEQKKALLF